MTEPSYLEYPADDEDLNDADHIRQWAKANNQGTAITEIKFADIGKYFRVWDPWFQSMAEAYLEAARLINAMFPNGVQAALAHRAEVSRVRTAYRQKRGRRW